MKILLSGITGQTASYATEELLNRGYEVHGIIRRSSNFNTQRIDHVYNHPNLKLHYGDLADSSSINSLVQNIKPDWFINYGAMSYVKASFEIPEYTFDVNATGVQRCLEAVRQYNPKTKFLQCSTSEMYGSASPPQSELSAFCPRSPYGVAKLAGYWATINYREAYGMFACNAISFNHESSRRTEHFVTRKITAAATRIKLGLQDKLVLGNLAAKRDWIFAGDVALGHIKMLEASEPDDYVLASGVSYSVQEFLEKVFFKLDLDWKKHVEISDKHFRPTEVDHLCGDASKIKKKLGWEPKMSFDALVDSMIEHDMKLARQAKLLKEHS